MRIISENSLVLLSLIDNIIDLAKIESGKTQFKNEYFDVALELKKQYSIYKELLKDKLELKYENLSEKKPVLIKSDPERFIQVFDNLMDNAIKFTEKGYISFGHVKKEKEIWFHIKDTGVGISSEQLDIIFDRFRKAENSNIKLFRGSGIGLTLSKNIIKLLGGDIYVESELDKGATFYFSLPLSD